MPTFTVKDAIPTGKTDPKFGTEYIVHFNEDQREVKLSRKNPVQAGQVEEGDIISGQYGAYFKKAPREFNGQGYSAPSAAPATPAKAPYVKKDNSDGMRQGMCINNAAAYVNSLNLPAMDKKDWANEVLAYANALYAKGDLTGDELVYEPFDTDKPLTIEDINEVFPS